MNNIEETFLPAFLDLLRHQETTVIIGLSMVELAAEHDK